VVLLIPLGHVYGCRTVRRYDYFSFQNKALLCNANILNASENYVKTEKDLKCFLRVRLSPISFTFS
jgi:hypothetical protein